MIPQPCTLLVQVLHLLSSLHDDAIDVTLKFLFSHFVERGLICLQKVLDPRLQVRSRSLRLDENSVDHRRSVDACTGKDNIAELLLSS